MRSAIAQVKSLVHCRHLQSGDFSLKMSIDPLRPPRLSGGGCQNHAGFAGPSVGGKFVVSRAVEV